MRLSERVRRIGESATLAVSRRAGELKAQGVEVVNLSAGEPDFDSPEPAVKAAVDALRSGQTRYTAAAGLPSLREAIADDYRERHGSPWEARNVVVTVGGKAALFELALALLNRDDEVVLPSPYWVTFPEQVRFCGARPVIVETKAEEGFLLRAEAVLEALSPRTRFVLLNSPSNPTGSVIRAEDLRTIVEACAERGVYVLSDETYERFLYDGARGASAAELASEYPDTVILVGSFSKTWAMTGWRIGFAICPAPIARAVTAIQSHATSNPTTFAMVGALSALKDAEDAVETMIAEYQVRRDLVMEGLSEIPGFECVAPAGAFYAFPRVSACYQEEWRSDDVDGSVEFCRHILDTARVALVPGGAFGAKDFVRISFAASREAIRDGLARIADATRSGRGPNSR